jgi:hypothetical protein
VIDAAEGVDVSARLMLLDEACLAVTEFLHGLAAAIETVEVIWTKLQPGYEPMRRTMNDIARPRKIIFSLRRSRSPSQSQASVRSSDAA